MHHVQLDLNHDYFYCPATRFLNLNSAHYEASPATLFLKMMVSLNGNLENLRSLKPPLKQKILQMNVRTGYLM